MPRRRLPPLLAAASLLAGCAVVAPAAPAGPSAPAPDAGPVPAPEAGAPAASEGVTRGPAPLAAPAGGQVRVLLMNHANSTLGVTAPISKLMATRREAFDAKTGKALTMTVSFVDPVSGGKALLAKLAGQVDVVYVTAASLHHVHKDFGALHLPGLLRDAATADAAVDAVRPDLERLATANGYALLGLVGEGIERWFTKGVKLAKPADLKGMKPLGHPDYPQTAAVYEAIGGVTPVRAALEGVQGALRTSTINVVRSTSVAAEHHKWDAVLEGALQDPRASKAASPTIDNQAFGAIVASKAYLDRLTPANRALVLAEFKDLATVLQTRSRQDDAMAFARISAKGSAKLGHQADGPAWDAVYKTTREKLAGTLLDAALVAKVQAKSGR